MILLITAEIGSRGAGISSMLKAHESLLKKLNIEYSIFCTDKVTTQQGEVNKYKYVGPENFRFSIGLARAVFATKPKLIHLHGFWNFPTIVCVLFCIFNPLTKLVISPHGMFDPYALSKSSIKKVLFLKLFNILSKDSTIDFHCLTENEKKQVENIFPRCRYTIFPNFVDGNTYQTKYNKNPIKIVYLGRIEEKKNLAATITHIECILSEDDVNATLDIFGPFENKKIQKEIEELLVDAKYCTYRGVVAHNDIYETFIEYNYFILLSKSEGLPVALLEAMECGLLPIVNVAANIDSGVESFGYLVENLEDLGSVLQKMSDETETTFNLKQSLCHNYLKEKYSKKIVQDALRELYK